MADRDLETYHITCMADCGPLGRQTGAADGWHKFADSYTKIAQIPDKMTWSKKFTWPKLRHGYMWHIPYDINDEKIFSTLMPMHKENSLPSNTISLHPIR